MKVTYTLTEADMVNYAYYRYWAAPDKLKFRLIARLLLPGIAIVCGIFLMTRDMLLISGLFILAGLVLMIFGPKFIKRKFRKEISQMPEGEARSNLLAEHQSEITEDGLADRVNGKDYLTTWSMMENISETPDFVVIHMEGNSQIIIPRQAFADDELKVAFMSSVKKYIKG